MHTLKQIFARAPLVAVLASSFALFSCADKAPFEGDEQEPMDVQGLQQSIVNGSTVYPNSQPWAVSLRKLDNSQHCGGSIIHPSWIVTAKHCFKELTKDDLLVLAGDHSIATWEITEQMAAIAAISPHPTADISLLRLEAPLIINENVQTLALATSVPSSLQNMGWGRTSSNGAPSDILRLGSILLQNSSSGCVPGANEFCAMGRKSNGAPRRRFVCSMQPARRGSRWASALAPATCR